MWRCCWWHRWWPDHWGPPGCCNRLGPRPHPVQRLPPGPGDHQRILQSRQLAISIIMFYFYDLLFFGVCFSCMYTAIFLCSLARVGLKLFWLILMVVLDSTLKYFVLSLFVCLRLGGHTQLPSVLVLSALPTSLPPSVFNSVRNFGENQKLPGSSSQMNRKQIIPSGLWLPLLS